MKQRLRVGLMLDSLVVADWEARAVQDVLRGGHSEIVLVLVNASPVIQVPLRAKLPYALFSLYYKIENRLVRDRAGLFERRNIADLLARAEIIEVDPVRTKHTDSIPAPVVEEVRRHGLDVIVRFGFRILRGEILEAARFGVWSLHHGDNRVNRGQPAAFWEVMLEEPTTGVTLQKLDTTLDGGTVLDRTSVPTHPRGVKLNTLQLYEASIPMIARALERLHAEGAAQFFAASDPQLAPGFYSYPQYTTPRNFEMLGLLLRRAARHIRIRRPGSRNARWQLFYNVGSPLERRLHRYKVLDPPVGHSWSNPCAVMADGKHYVFCDESVVGRDGSVIVVIEFENDQPVAMRRAALERPYAVCCPFVFRDGETWYMIPGTTANRSLELYECADFPDVWALNQVLLENVSISRPTPVRHDGRWYVFGRQVAALDPSGSELVVFHAASLTGPFTRLQLTDMGVMSCPEPAGPFFRLNGGLYRPSRCDDGGGKSHIAVNRVLDLSPSVFREELADEIFARWRRDLVATQTITCAERLTVIDALVQ